MGILWKIFSLMNYECSTNYLLSAIYLLVYYNKILTKIMQNYGKKVIIKNHVLIMMFCEAISFVERT